MLAELDHPHRSFPVVHVAGTNGKGSTSVFISSILASAGYRVGLYTSPHLVSYRERIVVDGSPIGRDELERLSHRLEPLVRAVEAQEGDLTEFEMGTALAFTHFREARVDVAVVEVGLGGRLDATNVVHPEVAVITPVSLDHTQVLGSTVEQVAYEKAGIMKKGAPVVVGPQVPEAEGVFTRVARELQAPLWPVGSSERAVTGVSDVSVDWRGTCFRLTGRGKDWLRQPLFTRLIGEHQAWNAATAATVALLLADRGWKIGPEAVARGLEQACWPGRTEVIQRHPLVIMDGAHNPGSVEALAATLRRLECPAPVVVLYGTLAGKPVETMLGMLAPIGHHLVVTSVHGRTPGQDPYEVARVAASLWRGPVEVDPEPASALERAMAAAGGEGTVLVTGSLYLVGELRGRWPVPSPFPPGEVAGDIGRDRRIEGVYDL